jgi:EpsD family peptidyl-prolyl cis-trans isomerase
MVRRPTLLYLGLAASLLGACGSRDATIAAKVNGHDVPVASVRAALQRDAGAERNFDGGREASVRALERVIDQELLVQAALDARLERDPEVAQALESARRHVLAQAYIDRASAGAGDGSTGSEVDDFYRRNPALFSERRIYRFQEMTVEGPAEKLASLKDQVGSAVRVEDVAAWLRSRNVPFTLATSTRPAEQVPFNYLNRLASMKDGELALLPTQAGVSVLQLIQSQEAPLTEAQAAPRIERFLASRRRLQGAEETLVRLRSKARIEYQGEFRPPRQEVSLFISRGRN